MTSIEFRLPENFLETLTDVLQIKRKIQSLKKRFEANLRQPLTNGKLKQSIPCLKRQGILYFVVE